MPTAIAQRAAFGALLAFSVVGAPPPDVRDLFRPSKSDIVRRSSTVPGSGALRVEVNHDAFLALSTSPRRIAIDIDERTRYLVQETRSYWSPDGRTWLWHGRIDGIERGHVVLAATGPLVSASIDAGENGFYTLRPADNAHLLERGQPEPARAGTDTVRIPRAGPPAPAAAALSLPDLDKLFREAAADTRIDVLVAYTGRVRSQMGSTAAVENRINLAIAEANQAMQNSNIPIEFQLARAMEVAYPEDQEANLSHNTILWRLRNPSDGYFDDVPPARAQYNADLVSLWIHGAGAMGGVVGIAFQLDDPTDATHASWSYSVVENNFALGPYFTMSHEFGHMMGATHDRNNANPGDSAFPYAFGYQHSGSVNPFRTIMAYPCNGVYCPVINYWSNPDVQYQGLPTGLSASLPNAADNAQALRNTRSLVAGFSNSLACSHSLTPSSLSPPASGGTFLITVTASGGCSWTAIAYESWISLNNASGSGNGSFSLTIQSNGQTARSGLVQVGQAILNISQPASSGPLFPITVTSNPIGASLTVDGQTCVAPCTYSWPLGSTHTLSTALAAGDPTRFSFLNWNTGASLSQTIIVTGAATYTANYKLQHRLSVTAAPSSAGSVAMAPASPDGFYDAGTPVTLTPHPASGYQLLSWSGHGGGPVSPLTLFLNTPYSITANFGIQPLPVQLTTNPPGVTLTVDGALCTTPCSQAWSPGRTYTVSAPASQTASGARYTFLNWNHGGSATQSITMGNAPATYIANYNAVYQLNLAVHPPGAGQIAAVPPSSDGFYAPGTSVQLTATAAAAGASFTHWSGDLAGSATPATVAMNGARAVTANFATANACAPAFDTSETSVPGSGDLRSLRILAAPGCAWSATSSANWLTVASSPSGSGPATLRLLIPPNTTAVGRTGTITAGSSTFTLHQPPAACTYAFSSAASSVPSGAGNYTVSIQTQPNCPWTASSTSNGLTLGPARSGTGSATLAFAVTANPNWVPRPLTLLIAGQNLRYLQSGSPAPSFTDVTPTHPFFDAINFLGANRVTTGCNGSAQTYCPEAVMTRAEMAAFIVRSLYGETFTAPSAPYFSDVPAGHASFRYIQKLRELDVTNGCTAASYCPDAPVTRGQMAAFLIRALAGISPTETFPFPASPFFTDVPPAHPFFGYIQKLRELGVTSGCTATTYCADETTTRGQMAAFLTRGFF
ncbi:MAG: S-layer homology domain-containing protein [Bryobacterales bacterium]|nr:S-layer homology domain-containing protein [Bryobacterales bacterium]